MKKYCTLLLTLLILLTAIRPAALPAHAQSGGDMQVWLVRDPDANLITIEYRDVASNVLASYGIALEGMRSPSVGGSRLFGWDMSHIPIFNAADNTVFYYEPAMPPDTETLFHGLTEGAARQDGLQFAYTIAALPTDLASATAANTVHLITLNGTGIEDNVILEMPSDQLSIALDPFGWSADNTTLLFQDKPMGIGGYILYWQWSNVRAYHLTAATWTPIGDIDGYTPDLTTFARVERDDSGVTGLTVFDAAGASQTYPLPMIGEVPFTGGDATFSPDTTKVAYQVARSNPDQEKIWTIVVDRLSGVSVVALVDEAQAGSLAYGSTIGGWLDNNTFTVSSDWQSGSSAIIDAAAGTVVSEAPGEFLGTVPGIATFAPSGFTRAQCPGAPPSQLWMDVEGGVTFTNGIPINVRQMAGGEQIGTQPEGATFRVMGGPICWDGYAWWIVSFADGMYGAVAEGDSSGYFIEPLP